MDNQPTDLTYVRARLHEFTYYFLKSLNAQFNVFRDILEGNTSATKKPNSLPISIASSLLSTIPHFGTPIGTGLEQGENYIVGKFDKKNACALSEIVYFSRDSTDALRDTIIIAAFELFRSFEMQFVQVNCRGGPTRAMQKLADDASYRLVSYLLKKPSGRDITSELIVKGVLYGESKLGVTKSGRTLILQNTDDKITTSNLYTKIGICIKNGETKFYKNKKSNTVLLGHRLPFRWEDVASFEDWQSDDNKSTYDYKLHSTDCESETEDVRKYLIKMDPLEDIKESNKGYFDTQIRLLEAAANERRELRDQGEENHDHTVKSMENNQAEVINTIKEGHKELLTRTDEKYCEMKEIIVERHTELAENIEVIRRDISTAKISMCTEEEHDKLSKDIAELKEKDHEDIYLKINRKEVRKVEETFKQVDPVRAISKSGDFKKLRRKMRL